jgi:hypothetical protein
MLPGRYRPYCEGTQPSPAVIDRGIVSWDQTEHIWMLAGVHTYYEISGIGPVVAR